MTTPLAAAPIPVPVTMAGYLSTDAATRFTEPHLPRPVALRATPQLVLSADTAPTVVRGVPTIPEYGVTLPVTVTATVGPDHIHPVPDPNPVWDPDAGVWVMPPGPSGVGDFRWSVWTLPDPSGPNYPDGTYPLGARSDLDDTDEIEDGATAWAPDRATGGVSWQSGVPFKPEVSDRNVRTADGQQLSHPVGISFAARGGAHMWLDMGAPMPQPFTWVIVAIAFSPPTLHTILDSGRNTLNLMGQVSETQQADGYAVPDNLAYRTTLQVAGPGYARIDTAVTQKVNTGVGYNVKQPFLILPRMYGAVYNGANSMLWVRGVDVNQVAHGTVPNGAGYDHRYYALGREYGGVNPNAGCEMFLLEVRFWHRALSEGDMYDQYQQLAATYKFAQYQGAG